MPCIDCALLQNKEIFFDILATFAPNAKNSAVIMEFWEAMEWSEGGAA